MNNFLHYKGVHFQVSSTIQKKEGEIKKKKSQKILNFQQTNKKLVVLTFFPKPIKLTYWVLVTGPLDQPIELLSISPGGSFLGMPDLMGKGDVSGYNMKILTVENSGCRV